MTVLSMTLREDHRQELGRLLATDDGSERAAYLLCGECTVARDPWDGRTRRRFLSVGVLPVPASEVVSASPVHVTWQSSFHLKALAKARADGLVAFVVHIHPGGEAEFSPQDDANEADLWRLGANRDGDGHDLGSLLVGGNGALSARLWTRGAPAPIGSITTIGEGLALSYAGRGRGMAEEAFARQALAFGEALNGDLRRLRVGVVGCGGTGSAVAMLLARLGVGQIALFDEDVVERTNLNRLHGARQSDADAMRPKVHAVAASIADMGLGVRAIPFRGWIGDPALRDALKSCDVVFGCTDDHDGRMLLNRFAAFYLVPVIDIGLAVEVSQGADPVIMALDGRVTWLFPGGACLLCRQVIDPAKAHAESLKRSNPAEYEMRKREAYVAGEGNPAPAVVTFTTELACMAVNELIDRLHGFRRCGRAANRVRQFHLLEDRRPGARPDPHCPVCGSDAYWGRGDVEPFLDRVG